MSYYIKQLKPRKCPICGEEFIVEWTSDYIYKRGSSRPKYFCGWNCMRAYDRQKEAKRQQRLKHE